MSFLIAVTWFLKRCGSGSFQYARIERSYMKAKLFSLGVSVRVKHISTPGASTPKLAVQLVLLGASHN